MHGRAEKNGTSFTNCRTTGEGGEMKKYRIRKNSPAEYIRDIAGSGLVGLVFLLMFLTAL